MSSLVTGASGFLGQHLVNALLDLGQPVRALLRNADKGAELARRGVETVIGDACDPAVLSRALAGANVVYHCAAANSVRGEEEIAHTNRTSVRNLFEAAVQARPGRIVLLSSINSLGSRSYQNATETSPTRRSGDLHADIKIENEELAAEYRQRHGLDICVLRPGLIYGPQERHLPKIASAIVRGKFRFIGSRDNVVPLIYVDDMLAVLLAAGTQPIAANKTYNVTDGSRTTIGQLADTLAELLQVAAPKKVLPYFLLKLVVEFFALIRKKGPLNKGGLRFLGTSRHVDISLARRELGFQPQTNLRAGLEKTLAWLREAMENPPK